MSVCCWQCFSSESLTEMLLYVYFFLWNVMFCWTSLLDYQVKTMWRLDSLQILSECEESQFLLPLLNSICAELEGDTGGLIHLNAYLMPVQMVMRWLGPLKNQRNPTHSTYAKLRKDTKTRAFNIGDNYLQSAPLRISVAVSICYVLTINARY